MGALFIQKIQLHIFWKEGKNNLTYNFTKKHPIWYHRTMRPKILKLTQKYIVNSKDQENGTKRGCSGTSKPGLTRKLDRPIHAECSIVCDVIASTTEAELRGFFEI